MKKTLITALVLGLVAGSLALPAETKKRKRKPAPVQAPATFFLRLAEGKTCGDEGANTLSRTDGDDGGTACGSSAYGIPNDAGAQNADPTVWVAADGTPFTLDATKEITCLIGVKSRTGVTTHPTTGETIRSPFAYGAGNTTLNIAINGTTGGEITQIGAATIDYQVIPGTDLYEIEFSIQPPAELDKKVFTTLDITLYNSGDSVQHGFYTSDEPASNFTIGTWALP